jgi:O-antigen ligase
VVSESKAFVREEHDSGSTSIRLTIWKVQLSHVKEFWLFGEGPIYAKKRFGDYLIKAGYQRYVDTGYVYHNQYLAEFHYYGVAGLFFLTFLLFYPLYSSLRRRRFSMALTAITVVFAIALMEDRYLSKDMVAALLFMLYFSFFQVDKWRFLENKTPK